MIDLGEHYRGARERIIALVSDDVATVRVPATPDWSVHDLISHLAGVTEDAANGNMNGVTTDEWTEAQVRRGRNKSLPELIRIWQQFSPMVESFLSSPSGANAQLAVIDIATHEADLRHALGLSVDVPSELLGWAARFMRDGFVDAVASAGLPPVEVRTTDFEWFRGRLGRRTVEEVCSYDWSSDPKCYLDTWFVFGRAHASLGE